MRERRLHRGARSFSRRDALHPVPHAIDQRRRMFSRRAEPSGAADWVIQHTRMRRTCVKCDMHRGVPDADLAYQRLLHVVQRSPAHCRRP